MTDLQDIRSRLREDVRRGSSSSSSDEGGGGKYTLVIVGCGVIIGFALFMFVPRFFQTGGGTAVMRDVGAVRVDTRISDGGRYTGKSPEDTATIADEVCAVRTGGRPGKPLRLGDQAAEFLTPEGMKHIHEQMTCLLTEGPMRFCSNAQRKMIVNELTLYFRGIENANRAFGVIRGGGAEGRKSISDDINPDPRVLAALDTRLHDGQLTVANRDVISSEAPRWVRDRLVKIVPRQSVCPEKPWWAIWR